MFDAPLPVGTEKIVSETIFCWVDLRLQSGFQSRPLVGIQLYLEHRELNALAKIPAGFGDAPEPPGPAGCRCTHIVGDQDHHGIASFPEQRRIAVKITAKVTRKKERLKVRRQANRCALADELVLALFAFALLPGGQNGLTSIVRQEHRATVSEGEVVLSKLAPVNERQSQPISKCRPQLFHEVERKARPPRPILMQEANRRIEPDTFKSAATFMRKQNIEKGQKRVHRIKRRPTRPAIETKPVIGRTKQTVEDAEVKAPRLAFMASQGVNACSLTYRSLKQEFESAGNRGDSVARWRRHASTMIAQGPQKDRSLIGKLPQNDAADDFETRVPVGHAVLRAAQQYVSGNWPLNARLKTADAVKENEGDARAGAGSNQCRRYEYGTKHDNRGEHMKRGASLRLAFDLCNEIFSVLAKARPLSCYVHGIEQLLHAPPSSSSGVVRAS